MLIKEIKRFCDAFLLTESMSIKEFRNEIKGRLGSDLNILKVALDYFKRNKDIKKEISLNDYLSLPLAFGFEMAKDFYEKYVKTNFKNQFAIIEETSDWVLVSPFTHEASYYLSHNYLRQKGDEKSFGSGPTWCISNKDDAHHWYNYTSGKKYPVVYFIISKTNSRDRYAIVFNNIHQDQSQKEKDIEFSKENFEKGYPISKMNGEIRDFGQKLSRKKVIEKIENKFGIKLGLSIKSRKKDINLSKIVYDNFDKTLDTYEKREEVSDEDDEIFRISRACENMKDKYIDFGLRLMDSIFAINETGLKYKKDYHPLTFDIILKNKIHQSYNYDCSSESTKEIIKESKDLPAFYCLFLMSWILSGENDVAANFILRSIIPCILRDKEICDDYINSFKKCISTNMYPNLLNKARHYFNTEESNVKYFYFIKDMVGKKVYGMPNEVLDIFYLFEPSLKKFEKGFNEDMLSTIVDVLSNYELAKRAFDLYRLENDEDIKKFILKYYSLDNDGYIHNRSDEKTAIDFLFVGLNIEDYYRENFCEVLYSDEDGRESALWQSLKRIKKFLIGKNKNINFESHNHIKEFVDFYNSKLAGFNNYKTRSYEEILEDVLKEIDILFKENGYDMKTVSTFKYNLTSNFYFPKRKA